MIRTAAQTSPKFKVTPLVETTTPTPTATLIEYPLPYPGMLPDHFLYPLKMARDKVWLLATLDKQKKAGLLLTFADKRVGAAKALIDGGKVELGISTLFKAEQYFEQAVAQTKEAQSQGKKTEELERKLATAALKHLEIITQLEQKISGDSKAATEKMKKRLLEINTQLESAGQ